jgi:hypothetical protein
VYIVMQRPERQPPVFPANHRFSTTRKYFAVKIWTTLNLIANSTVWRKSRRIAPGKRCVVCTQHAWQGGVAPVASPFQTLQRVTASLRFNHVHHAEIWVRRASTAGHDRRA